MSDIFLAGKYHKKMIFRVCGYIYTKHIKLSWPVSSGCCDGISFFRSLIALFPRDLYNDISSRPVLFFFEEIQKKILDVSIQKIGYVVALFGGQRRQYDLT